jgi:hypothetical protein
METRYVTVPADIMLAVENPMTQKLVTAKKVFFDLIKERTADNGHFGKTLDGLMMGLAIRQHFTGSNPGDVVGLPLDQWEALCKAMREPTNGYNPEVMFQLLPMVTAVIDAPSTKPETKSIDLGAATEESVKPEASSSN